ncbi:hypothetical protein P5V15_007831 [Pogonomyrmex californicus]
MSKNSYNEMIQQINEAQMQLKIRLEQVSKLRTDCAKLQLELLKLYKPECLEILEMLKIFESVDSFGSNDDNSQDGVLMLKYIYYILNIGLRRIDRYIDVRYPYNVV